MEIPVSWMVNPQNKVIEGIGKLTTLASVAEFPLFNTESALALPCIFQLIYKLKWGLEFEESPISTNIAE
jgi:hypothetical protein